MAERGVVEKSFLPAGKTVFYTFCKRFILPNRFSTDSSETVRIFAFTLPTILRRYKYESILFFFSINSHGETISAEILSWVYRDILFRRLESYGYRQRIKAKKHLFFFLLSIAGIKK